MGTADTPAEPIRGLIGVALRAVHEPRDQHAGGRADGEGDDAQREDAQGVDVEELLRHQLRAHGEAEKNRGDVDQGVLRRCAEALHDAALAHQVAEAQHAEERRGIGQQQRHEDKQHEREGDALPAAHLPQLRISMARSSVVSARMIGGWISGTSAM
jgi:hypothetical protein